MTSTQTVNLHLSMITMTGKTRFPQLVAKVLAQIELESDLRNKTQDRILIARKKAVVVLMEGLYQSYCCLTRRAAFSLPLSSSAYSRRDLSKIQDLSHTAIQSAVRAFEALGWIHLRVGYRRSDGTNVSSSIQPSQELLERFNAYGIRLFAGRPPTDVLVLKNYEQATRTAYEIPPPDSDITRRMRATVSRVNRFIGKHAICLHLSNENLLALAERMGQEEYETEWFRDLPIKKPRVFNFNQVSMRRIFARGSLKKGGRWYGGWWQFIPSEYRQYVTIDGFATGEVDFSELHPRLLYRTAGLPPPDGDLYDLGIVSMDDPRYAVIRKVAKRFFNALLNDERSRYRLPPELLHLVGMSNKDFKEQLLKRHPVLRNYLGKGVGLEFQFLDSQITEKILVACMNRDLVVLPIHDSFICQRHRVSELILVMRQAYQEVIGAEAVIKPVEPYRSDYQLPFTQAGKVDLQALYDMHTQSLHNRFLSSWHQASEGRGPHL
jgi:hypothetical protein